MTFLPSSFFLEEIKPVVIIEENTVTGQDTILEFCQQPRTAKEIMCLLKLKHRESFYKQYLKPLLKEDRLLMTIPHKPQSRNQQYLTKSKTDPQI